MNSPSEWLVAGHEVGEETAGDVSHSFVWKEWLTECVVVCIICDVTGSESCEREKKDFDKCEGGK